MVEHSIQGIVIIQDFRIVYTNRAFAKISGYSKRELLALTPAQIEKVIHKDYQDLVWGRMRVRLKGEKIVPRYEFKGVKKDGSIRWLEMLANRIEYEGKPAILGSIIDITDRKEAEEALQKSQANLMALFENSQASIWSVDRDFKILTINSYFKKMFALAYGIDLKVGMNITDCVSPEMKRTWIARYNRALRGESFSIEEDYLIAGQTVNSEISFYPIRSNGKITGVSVFAREITEQKKAQEKIRESEEKYRSIIDLAPDGIVTTDLKGVITSCNSAFLRQTGLSSEELVGIHFSKMPGLFKSDISSYFKVIADLIRKKPVRAFEAKWKHADGAVRWGEIHVATLKRGRSITGFQAITRDITERKRTEEELLRTSERFQTIVETVPSLLMITDAKGKNLYVSPNCQEITGYSQDELLGRIVWWVHKDDHSRAQKVFNATLTKGRGRRNFEYKAVKKNGDVWYATSSWKTIKNRKGKLQHIVMQTIDITARKNADVALKESEERLKILFEFAPYAYYLSDLKGTFIDGNRAAERLIGFPRDELIGKSFLKLKLLNPNQLAKAAALLAKNALGKATGPDEFTICRKDGTQVQVDIRTYPVKIKNETFVLGLARDITAHKNAENALRESEKKFRNIVESSPMGMHLYEYKSDGRVVFIGSNPAADEILGVDNSQFLDKTIEEAFPPLSETEVPQRFKDAATKGIPWQTHQISYVDDRIKGAFQVHAFQTSPGKMAAMFLDVTEKMKAEEALHESEARYLALFDRSLYGVFLHDFCGNFLDANKAALSMLGYSKEDISSLDFASLLSEDQLPMAFKGIEEILKEGYQKKPSVYRLRRKDGTHIWVETEATLISKGGKPYAIQGIARDVTEHKQAEEALRESEEKYRAIFESFHDVYYRTDREGFVTIISPSVKNHAGWDPEDIIGHPVTDFYKDPSERELFKEKLKETGVINDYELTLLAKDGRVIDVSVSSKIIFGKDRNPIGVEGVLRDITDRKRAEEQVRSSLKEKEVLLQEIHHRVKNNMQIISSLLNLQSRNISDENVREMFKMSRDRIKSMALIHEKLYQSENLSKINFAQYVQSLTLHLRHTYNTNVDRIKLDTMVKDVFLDINKAIPCGLIINELVSNSLKHAFPDNKKGNIQIHLHTGNNGDIRLLVSDDGIGFAKDVNIQKPDSLGLQLVNDLVEQLEGTLKLDLTSGTSYEISFST